MDIPAVLIFDPALVRSRRDGWTPDVQRHFILHLARGARPGEAARRVGRARSTAYALRDRPDAEGFAAAWDAALDVAAEVREAARPSLLGPNLLGDGGLEAMLVPRFYRGRLVGFVQREDHRAALRVVGRLDRLAERIERTGGSPGLEDAMDDLARSFGAEADKADRIRA